MLSWGDFNQNWLFVLAVFLQQHILYFLFFMHLSLRIAAPVSWHSWTWVYDRRFNVKNYAFGSDNIIQSSNWFSMAQIESFWLVGFSFHPVYQCVYLNRLNCFCVHWNKEFRCMKLNLQHNFNVYCFEKRGLAPANPSRFLVTELPNWV